jgi:hypothetical protein
MRGSDSPQIRSNHARVPRLHSAFSQNHRHIFSPLWRYQYDRSNSANTSRRERKAMMKTPDGTLVAAGLKVYAADRGSVVNGTIEDGPFGLVIRWSLPDGTDAVNAEYRYAYASPRSALDAEAAHRAAARETLERAKAKNRRRKASRGNVDALYGEALALADGTEDMDVLEHDCQGNAARLREFIAARK